MYTQQDLNNVINYAKDNLDLANATLSEGFYYDSLPLCVIDSIFSIALYYSRVVAVVDRVATKLNLNKYQQVHGEPADTYKISDFLNDLEPYMSDDAFGATNLYECHNLTSSRSGILKSEAVFNILNVLQRHGINDIESFKAHKTETGDLEDEIANDFMAVRGQGSGISLAYLYMLTGDDNFIKSDRWIKRFIIEATSKDMNNDDIVLLLRAASEYFKQEYPNMTPRLLDHTIWSWIKGKEQAEEKAKRDANKAKREAKKAAKKAKKEN